MVGRRQLFRWREHASEPERAAPTGRRDAEPLMGWVPPVRRPPTVAGPSFEATISESESFGAWVEVPVAGMGAVQLTWSEGPQPVLSLADPQGSWRVPEEQPHPPLHTAWLELEAGWTWVCVEAPWSGGQAIRVAVWLPTAAGGEAAAAA